MSSRSTVKKYLVAAGIPIRAEEHRIGGANYGERKLNGRIVPHQKELELMAKMKTLRQQGPNFQQIANILQGLDLPTRRGGKWTRNTVQQTLRRMQKKEEAKI